MVLKVKIFGNVVRHFLWDFRHFYTLLIYWLTIVILALPTLSLAFFVTEYIQCRKDKENVEVIKKTLSYAVFYLACLTVLAISILYFFLRYIYGSL